MLEPGALCAHAERLLQLPSPLEADVRRAVSASYYAVFHLLTTAAAQQGAGPNGPAVSARLRRSIDHKQVRKVCDSIAAARGAIPRLFEGLIVRPPSAALATLAATFAELQDARHAADYDLDIVPTFREARLRLTDASAVLRSWDTIASDTDASVFLTLILLPERNLRRG